MGSEFFMIDSTMGIKICWNSTAVVRVLLYKNSKNQKIIIKSLVSKIIKEWFLKTLMHIHLIDFSNLSEFIRAKL